MQPLNFELNQLCLRNRDGSYATQSDRQAGLRLIANDLLALGFRKLTARGLKPKHIEALVQEWQSRELSTGTIKNRMSHMRWWAEKINKPSIIAKSNDDYGIERRVFVTNVSKARILDRSKLILVEDEYLKFSLRLQSEFGLRREEAIKFIAQWADRHDHIALKASWCKGGRARVIPIANIRQRELIDEIKAFAKGKSLIPKELKYVDQLHKYEYQTAKAGLDKNHGLRHYYAQMRYLDLTGREAPAGGGKTSKELTKEEKLNDHQVRLLISEELGHEREQVTAIYLGR